MSASNQSNTRKFRSSTWENLPAPKFSRTEFKCIVLGDHGAGKTCLVQRVLKDKYSETVSSIQADREKTSVQLPSGDSVQVELWDTAGQERFRSLTWSFFRDTDAVVLVYDVNKDGALLDLSHWFKESEQFLEKYEVMYFVVGTKMDMCDVNADQAENAKKFFKARGVLDWFYVSSKTGENVHKMMQTVAERVVKMRRGDSNVPIISHNDGTVSIPPDAKNRVSVKKTCC